MMLILSVSKLGKSCVTQLLEFPDDITESIDQGEILTQLLEYPDDITESLDQGRY